MRCFVMFITAVCKLFLFKLKWPQNKSFYDCQNCCGSAEYFDLKQFKAWVRNVEQNYCWAAILRVQVYQC